MNKFGRHVYLLLVYGLLYLPILIVIGLSFNASPRALIWQGFTWRWYVSLFHDTSILQATWHSLVLGIIAASLATLIGFIASVACFRYRFMGRKVIRSLAMVLIVVPEIVIAISLLLLYNFLHIPLGFWSLLLGHTALCVPLALITISGQLTELDRDIFAAAKDLGANDFNIIKAIIFPLMSSALASAWLLSFTLSMDDIIISYFVGGPSYSILPFKIYALVRFGVKPEINALCSIMLIFTLVMTLIIYHIMFQRKKYEADV